MHDQIITGEIIKGVVKRLQQYLEDKGLENAYNKLAVETFAKLVALAKTRMSTLSDFYDLTRHFFEDSKNLEFSQKEKDVAKKLLEVTSGISFEKDTILPLLKDIMKKEQIKMPVLYKILTGKEQGLPLPETVELLGKEEVVKRLKRAA